MACRAGVVGTVMQVSWCDDKKEGNGGNGFERVWERNHGTWSLIRGRMV